MANLDELRQLVDDVMHASTKQEAQHPLRRLKFLAAGLKVNMDPYYARKLGEVISYAEEASGRVSNKQHWISCADRSWYTFEYGVKHP
jgi:hypothetical protein